MKCKSNKTRKSIDLIIRDESRLYLFLLLEHETFKFDMFSDNLFVHIFCKM